VRRLSQRGQRCPPLRCVPCPHALRLVTFCFHYSLGFCGVGIGEEGYGQYRRCASCAEGAAAQASLLQPASGTDLGQSNFRNMFLRAQVRQATVPPLFSGAAPKKAAGLTDIFVSEGKVCRVCRCAAVNDEGFKASLKRALCHPSLYHPPFPSGSHLG